MKPLISVIIPSFNRAEIIERAINSVLIQEFQDWELIVVDDGSTDDTKEKLLPFLSHPQTSYYSQPNAGVSAARNYGAEMAKGDWLIFLDSDDELAESALIDFAKTIQLNPVTEVIAAGIIFNWANKKTILLPVKGKYIGHIPGSFAIKKSFFDVLGGYDARLKFAENTELFFRIDSSGKPIVLLFKATINYYDNEDGGSKNLRNSTDSILLILEKHCNTIPNTTKRLYHQILGVNFMRFQDYEKAKHHLAKAFWINPKKVDTLGRLIIANMPFIARKLYIAKPAL